ncbi:hypothetical protein TrST_g2467 [Triparma strigata]|uniref:Uncharacterized protein n=1 Tax=Triparma strigata TaxID=1606541 RepID=A0A9W7BLR6_9STRA|nr:hypothetical protein TrST_g2467 [Triparma strigata]
MCAASLLTGMFLQPLNTSLLHRTLLTLQLFVCFILPDTIDLSTAKKPPRAMHYVVAGVRISLGVTLFFLLLKWRKRVASLTPDRLSKFLTDSLLIPGIRTLVILAFFTLDPVRCWKEYPDRSMCKRTLISQAAIGLMAVIQYMFSVLVAVFPVHVIKKHSLSESVSLYKIATFNLRKLELVKIGGFVVSISCAFFLLAQYNSRGRMNRGEVLCLLAVGLLGVLSISVLGIWEWALMLRKTLRERSTSLSPSEAAASTPAPAPPTTEHVLKLHWLYEVLGLFATSLSLALGTLEAITLDTSYGWVQYALMPFVMLAGVPLAFFSDVRNKRRTFFTILWLTFVSGEFAAMVFNIRTDSFSAFGVNVGRVIFWCVLFRYGKKARAKIGSMNDADLTNFYLDGVLKNTLSSLTGTLFVMFRAFNCVLGKRSIAACMNDVWCAMFISLYLVSFVVMKILVASMPEVLRRSHAFTWEKLATMDGIRKRNGMEGFF